MLQVPIPIQFEYGNVTNELIIWIVCDVHTLRSYSVIWYGWPSALSQMADVGGVTAMVLWWRWDWWYLLMLLLLLLLWRCSSNPNHSTPLECNCCSDDVDDCDGNLLWHRMRMGWEKPDDEMMVNAITSV